MPILPYNQLFDEQDKRFQDLSNKMGQFGNSLVQAPLTYQTLLAEQQDRANKIEMDKQELLNKKAQAAREQSLANKEDFELGQSKDKAQEAKQNEFIQNYVNARMAEPNSDGTPKTQDQIMSEAFSGNRNPFVDSGLFDNEENGVNPDQIASKVASAIEAKRQEGFKEKIAQEGADTKQATEKEKEAFDKRSLDIKQQNADTLAKKVSARLNSLPKPDKLAPQQAQELLNDQLKIANLEKLKQHASEQEGPLKGAFDSILGAVHELSPADAVKRRDIQDALNKALYQASGKVINESEYKRLAKTMPSMYDSEEVYSALIDAAMSSAVTDYNTKYDFYSKLKKNMGDLTHLDNSGHEMGPSSGIPAKNPGEKRSDYARRLEKAGLDRDTIMKAVLNAQ